MGRERGQITVFFALILLCVCSLMGGLFESARTAGMRWYLRISADSAMDSVFSHYHKEVWRSYRLLLLQREDWEMTALWEQFLTPYLEKSGWYEAALQDAAAEGVIRITDGNGRYLQQEIMDYMQYGIWKLDFDEDQAGELIRSLTQAAAAGEIMNQYKSRAREAVEIERLLEEMDESLMKQEEYREAGEEAIKEEKEGECSRQASKLDKECEKFGKMVQKYEDQAEILERGLKNTGNDLAARRDDMGEEIYQTLLEETKGYQSYTSQDGERRREILQAAAETEENRKWVRETVSYLEDRGEEEYEEADEAEMAQDGQSVWSEAADLWSEIKIPGFSWNSGLKDEEKQGFLEQIEKMAGSGLLQLLLPYDVTVSPGILDRREFPSLINTNNGGENVETGLTEKLLLFAYIDEFFSDFSSQERKEVIYEQEYIIGHGDSDEKNLEAAVLRMVILRQGLNFLHILTDPQKREESKALAAVIAGITGIAPLVDILGFFIMGVWALGEALTDVKSLLEGRKVVLIKTRENWNLDLEGLLEMGKSGQCKDGGENESGFNYRVYLKLLMLLEKPEDMYYRIMDLIQMNIRRQEGDFRMAGCVWQAGIRGKVQARRGFGFYFGGADYQLEVYTEKAY